MCVRACACVRAWPVCVCVSVCVRACMCVMSQRYTALTGCNSKPGCIREEHDPVSQRLQETDTRPTPVQETMKSVRWSSGQGPAETY